MTPPPAKDCDLQVFTLDLLFIGFLITIPITRFIQCKLNNDGTWVVGVERRTDDEDKVHKPQMFVEVDLVVVDRGEWVQKEECLFWGMRLQNHYHFYPVVVHRLELS